MWFLGWAHFSVPETGTVLAPSSGHLGPRYGDRSEYQKREPLLVPKTGTASGSQNGNRFWFQKRGPLLVPRAGAALGTRPGAVRTAPERLPEHSGCAPMPWDSSASSKREPLLVPRTGTLFGSHFGDAVAAPFRVPKVVTGMRRVVLLLGTAQVPKMRTRNRTRAQLLMRRACMSWTSGQTHPLPKHGLPACPCQACAAWQWDK